MRSSDDLTIELDGRLEVRLRSGRTIVSLRYRLEAVAHDAASFHEHMLRLPELARQYWDWPLVIVEPATWAAPLSPPVQVSAFFQSVPPEPGESPSGLVIIWHEHDARSRAPLSDRNRAKIAEIDWTSKAKFFTWSRR